MVAVNRVLSGSIIFVLSLVLYTLHGWTAELKINAFNAESQAILQISEQNESPYTNDHNSLTVPFEDLMKGPYTLPGDHPMLIKHIQQSLVPPSNKPARLPDKDPSRGQQAIEIINILGEMRNTGFYVEAGAFDGQFQSNTVIFERIYGWKGLLVEANPALFDRLIQKQRNAWSINCCISLNNYPNRVMFRTMGPYGKITNKDLTSELDDKYAQIQCVPFFSILLALNTTTIDFFSLDVEGFELDVLKTIPWDKVNIRTLSVEFININTGKDIQGIYKERNASNIIAGREALRFYMDSVGYNIYTEAGGIYAGLHSDYIFYRKDIVPQKPSHYIPS